MTEAFTFPILSVIIFTPIVAAVVMLFIDGEKRDLIRGISITATVIVLVLVGSGVLRLQLAGA